MLSLACVTVRRMLRLGVGKREPLARFLLSKGDYAATTRRVKPQALMPAPDGKTSVYRIGGLSDASIMRVGVREVGAKRNKEVRGWAAFFAADLAQSGLRADANDRPPRHVDIVGWPKEKDERLQVAQELAARCGLRLGGEMAGGDGG